MTGRRTALGRVGRAGVVLGYIAEGHLITGEIVRAIAAGRPLPVQAHRTVEQGAAVITRQARRLATRTRNDTLTHALRHEHLRHDLMDPTIDAMLFVYAAALRRHQQHLEDGCDRHAWHVLARHLIERAVWSANSTEEAVRDGRPLWFNPNLFNQNDH